ncbi:biotin transporter BioY [Rhodobacter xanthinilyticus]|uniref:Biotin transporter n=1 Tax=Rhodobacter xanthinilyticus TaxID=1850250 RepID=A0A1D9MAY5_9RHOB|nr:biotin transporter BioY [Rhodobacter xanthinilyticus]AOZ69026.1 biotin transporter BioY [Rhodobacter xanthinilyticus]
MTLSKALVPSTSIAPRAAMVLGGSALLAVASQISVPMFPVPMTLQTLAVLTIGLTMGTRMGVATVAAWLAQAAMGLPVLANGGSTAAFFGPTAGFLLGFLAMVAVAGFAADRGVKSVIGLSLAGLAATVVLYIPGLAYPAVLMGKTMPELLSGWMMPFLAGDAVKAVLAALVVSGGWAALAKRG